MDWLKNLFNSNPLLALGCPSVISCIGFFGNLASALSDGQIDSNEFHTLMASASGIQMLLLIAIMFALRSKNNDSEKK